jgi:hypothetical protein
MSAFDKYLMATGDDAFPWIDHEGVSYSSKVDFLCVKLGFCGCGDPESAIKYIGAVMEIMSEFNPDNKDWGATLDKLDRIFNSEGEKYFAFYYLDNLGLSEHGGSVPGWLTNKGIDFLAMIREVSR